MGRWLALAATVGAVALGVAACGSSSSGTTGGSSGSSGSGMQVVKIGVLNITSGPYTELSESTVNAIELGAEILNQQSASTHVKLETEDFTVDGTATNTVQAATKAAEESHVAVLLGFASSPVAEAVQARLKQLNVLYIDSDTQDDVLVGSSCNSNYFRTAADLSQVMQVAKGQESELQAAKTWSTIAPDYSTGHDFASSFEKIVSENGSKVTNNVYEPLGTTDFGTYITQLANNQTEGLFITVFGADQIALAKQQLQYGLFAKYHKILTNLFPDPVQVNQLTAAQVGNVREMLPYFPTMNKTPENTKFVEAWKAKYGEEPAYPQANTYAGMEMLVQAVQKAGSAEPEAIATALSGLSGKTVLGTVEFRSQDHQLMRPMAIAVPASSGNATAKMKLSQVVPTSQTTPPVSPDCHM